MRATRVSGRWHDRPRFAPGHVRAMPDQPTAALRRSPLERDVTLPMLLVAFAAAILAACAGCCVLCSAAWYGRCSRGPPGAAGERGPNPIEDVGRLAGVAVD